MSDSIKSVTAARPIVMTVTVKLTALVVAEPDGRYSVAVPALRGCVTQGDTLDEVAANIVEAAEGWLETMHDAYRDEDLCALRGEDQNTGENGA